MDGKAVPSDMCGKLHSKREHFVDRNGQVYAAILDYLRNGELPELPTMQTRNVGKEADRTGMVALAGICGNNVLASRTHATKRYRGTGAAHLSLLPQVVDISGRTSRAAGLTERNGGWGQRPPRLSRSYSVPRNRVTVWRKDHSWPPVGWVLTGRVYDN